MKKLCLSAIFAFAIFAAYAQEGIPQEEQILAPQEETAIQPTEGRTEISGIDLPQNIKEAFASSEFEGMTITEAYEVTGEALEEIPVTTQTPKPDFLYELVVEDSSRAAILYFTETGELYDTVEKI